LAIAPSVVAAHGRPTTPPVANQRKRHGQRQLQSVIVAPTPRAVTTTTIAV
jgi:hypothetical protein